MFGQKAWVVFGQSLEKIMVRFFDLFLSILLLFLTCPLLVLISVGCLLVDGRPILFSQQRVGSKGEIFTIYKFRTMRQPNSMETVQQAHRELDRVTSFGKWLRNTKFDELPQLFNVLYGSMSLVGPRPHEYRQDAKFKEQILIIVCGIARGLELQASRRSPD